MKNLITTALFLVQFAYAQTYKFSISTFIGENVITLAEVENTNQQFSIQSRKIIGMPQLLFRTDSVVCEGKNVSGSLVLAYSRLGFRGTVSKDSISFKLFSLISGRDLGIITGIPYDGKKFADYRELTQNLIETTEKNHYNIKVAQDQTWKKYKKQMGLVSYFFKDDLEMIGFSYLMGQKLSFSHYRFTRMNPETWKAPLRNGKDTPQMVQLNILNPETALLKISDFSGDGSMIDSLMQKVVAQQYANLIVDLRGNTGGAAASALNLVKYLSPEKRPAGALVTQRWFAANDRVPTQADYNQFATFDSGTTLDLLEKLNTEKGVVISTEPAQNQYLGKVFILTDKHTASTCEPTAYALQYYKRATLIGEKTAGSMLSKIPFHLGNGYTVMLPTADYFTFDGKRLDNVGVSPDVEVPAEKALEEAQKMIANANL